jgi:hypothetical protein
LSDQKAVVSRLKRKPPRGHWRREVKGEKLEEARAYWSVRELRRIEVAGAQLPEHQQPWFRAQLERFKDLQQMSRIDEGFMRGPEAGFVPPNPDNRYDLLSGTARLDALERALSSGERAWNDDPADRALDWIRQPGRTDSLVGDLETAVGMRAVLIRMFGTGLGGRIHPYPNEAVLRKKLRSGSH